jgi:hypothetical protein
MIDLTRRELMKRIGILTGGGDAPGLNAVIRAAWWHDPRRGESRAGKVKNVSGKTLKGIIRENVTPESRIMTDSFLACNGLDKDFASHKTVDHGIGEYVRDDVYTNTVEG